MRNAIAISFLVLLTLSAIAGTEKYRIMWRNNTAKTMVIGWVQKGADDAVVYYDKVDHGTDAEAYAFKKEPDRRVGHKGMKHVFARLTGLEANTAYYFVVKDSDGTSKRYWFSTMPDNPNERLSIIAGGDSRNNREPRQNANKLVSKLKPHFVAFGGDMTNLGLSNEWKKWLDDWQLTITEDGQMFPIVAARGNHERKNEDIINIFDVAAPNVYYSLSFGGNLLRLYTLNSEITVAGDQAAWLEGNLKDAQADNTIWKMAQYHRPIRPHVSSKSEREDIRNSWANLFLQYRVRLAVECDAHDVKTTWPIIPSYDEGHDEGFIRNDKDGTTYVGEGCWGAPIRESDDAKEWTRANGSFNQFKWIFVSQENIEVRTIEVDNAEEVGTVSEDRFVAPANLKIWSPDNGDVVKVTP